MDIDVIAQHASTIKELYQQYTILVQEKQAQLQRGMLDPKLEESIEKIRLYILKLSASIQKGIDEERENVYS